jgi:hypothetical protein
MADYYTRWVEAVPLPDQRAETAARSILKEIVSRYGVPAVLHSNKGQNFESKIIKELGNLLGMKKVRTTAYHQQCDGLVETMNQTILRMLAKHVAENRKDWDLWLPCVLLAYRSSKQSSTGQSPFRLMYGREARLPADVAMGLPGRPHRTTTEFISDLEKQQQLARKLVETQLAASQERQVRNAGTNADTVYEKGDYVWLHHTALPAGLSPKLSSPWKGPYRVLKCYDNATSKLNRFKEAEHSACTMTGSNLVHSVLLRKLEVSLSHNPLGVNLKIQSERHQLKFQAIQILFTYWTKQQRTPRQQSTSKKERRPRCPEAVQHELEAHHVG